MNKIFSKIAVVAVGAAMAIGVGVAASKKIARADAESANGTFGTGVYSGEAADGIITWSHEDGNIQMIQHKGSSSTNVNSTYTSAARVYMGNYLEFVASNDYKITKVEIKVDGGYYGQNLTAGVSVSESDVVDSVADLSRTWTTTSSGTHTVQTTDANGLDHFYIQNGYVKSGKQLRWQANSVKVYYEKPAQTGTITSVSVEGPAGETDELVISGGYLGWKFAQLNAVVEKEGLISPAVDWSSADSSSVSVDEDGFITILKNSSEGIAITATSVADPTKSGSILVKVDCEELDSLEEETTFSTAKYGSSNIISNGTTVFDTNEISESATGLSVARIVSNKAESPNDPGYYPNPASLRCYISSTLDLSATSDSKIAFIEFTSLESHALTELNTTASSGSFIIKGTRAILDCSNNPVDSVQLAFTSQVRFETIKFVLISAGPSFTIGADKLTLSAGESATITSQLFGGASGIVSYSNSNESVLTLVDNGDGTATVTAKSLPTDGTAVITGVLSECIDQTLEFTVAKDVEVNGIVVVSAPTKDTYYVNDTKLNLDGLVVHKTYVDGSQDPVDIADLEFDFDFGQVGPAEVTVTYLTFDTTFSVNVVEKPVIYTMTVAEALDAIAALDEPEAGKSTYGANVTVHGFVTSVGSWSDKYNNADVYMADEKGGTPTLQVFRFADKTVYDQLMGGTEINAAGQLAKFKDTNGNIKSELAAPKDGQIVIEILSQPTIVELSVAEALARAALIPDPTGDKETKTDSSAVTVHGYVTSKGSWSEQYGDANVYMADNASSSTTLQIFRFTDKTIFDQLMVGTEIKATGTLAKYRKDSSTPISIEFTGVAIEIVSTPTILELSVAEALARAALIPDPTGDKETKTDSATVKVHGYVVSLGSWSDLYGNADVYMADEKGGTSTLQVFRFSDKTIFDQLMVGTEINATGILAKYRKDSSTPINIEFTGATIEILSQPTIDELSVAQALARAALIPNPTGDKETKTDSASVKVHGYVVRINAWSGQYGNTDVYIADEVNGTPTLQVFRFGDVDVYKQLALGAEVKVLGTLAKYRKDSSTPISIEFANPQIEIISSPLVESLSFADAYTKVQGLDEPASGSTTYDTVNVTVQGYVVSKSKWDETYKDGSLYISDTASGTDTIQLYKVFEKDVFDAAEVGAKVEATGILAKNKSNAGVIKLEMSAVIVTVLEAPIPTVTGMTIEGAPKTTYYVGESIDLTGITKFVITYSDGTTADKTLGDVVLDDSLFDTSAEGDGIIAFNYTEADPTKQGSAHVEYAVTVIPAPVPCTIIFDNNGGTGTMAPITGKNVGDTITLPSADELTAPAGQQFKAWEINGTEYQVGASFTLAASEVTIKALWEDIPAPAPTLVDIVVTPTVFEYGLNGVIDKNTLTVMGSFSDSTERELASNEYVLIYDFSTPGDEVVVTVDAGKGVVATYNVTVLDTPAPTPCTITFDNNGGTGTMAPITGKNVGDTITLPSAAALTAPSGKEFKAWEINGTEYQVGASFTLAASEVTIKALWKDVTPVPPAPKTLTGIEVTPTVFEYNVGDVIDKSTITVVAIYSDGSRETIPASQFEALINTATAGDSVAVTITYGGKTYTYNVSVKAVEEAKKGCRGSVVATSAILSILSLAGVALLSVKKRKED